MTSPQPKRRPSMQERRRRRKQRQAIRYALAISILFIVILSVVYLLVQAFRKPQAPVEQSGSATVSSSGSTVNSGTGSDKTASDTASQAAQSSDSTVRKAKIMASGDILYHDLLYWSAATDKGYDFTQNFAKIKPLISSADLALGDFEGTISGEMPLAGYPLFNAPKEVVPAIKDAGYDVIDLAHNHILDSYLAGALNTKKLFEDSGIATLGIRKTAADPILVKEVNGIRIAVIGFAYGYNGMEANLTQEEYDTHMQDMNPAKVKATLEEAEKIADITIVMPQIGTEYSLEPTEVQKENYHNMISWGADIIFGGHPHVPEPTEIVEHNGHKKFILYSMGNLISNQRLETLDNVWTERGVIMEVNIIKNGNGPVTLESIQAHPTWVSRTPNGKTSSDGYELYNYQTLLCEDYIGQGQYADTLDSATQKRVESAYYEVMELMSLDPSLQKK
ncbi:MAG: CapA family protein [Lachnospiraceae bacterium]|nr:CapA family protein [Lachnospiraceae bacterium]MDY5741616.1 CapA family protein [Lachnospiraceae bacterium]